MTEPDSLFDSALAHHRAGRPAQAGAVCQEIIGRFPDHARALHLLGAIRYANGAADEGFDLVRRALTHKPDYAEAHFNLAAMLAAEGKAAEAGRHYAAAAHLKPDDVVAQIRHAAMLDAAGRQDDAITAYHNVLARWPDCLPALLDIGSLYLLRGDTAQAVEFNRRATNAAPDNFTAALRLGRSLKQGGELAAAVAEYRRALSLKPDDIEALNFLAVALYEQGALGDASTVISRAREIGPSHAPSHFNAGTIAQATGDIRSAASHLRQALQLDPENASYRRVFLANLLYDPHVSESERAAAHCDFGTWATGRAKPTPTTAASPDPERRLRIGWLSSDFRDHPVSRNMEPLLAHLDRSKFQSFLYGHVGMPDDTTRRLQTHSDSWCPTIGLSDPELAARIRADGIDILVVLAGHFDHNRPEIAAWRAAPVQISFHDPATSGIAAFDYLIADRRLAPRRREEWVAERPLLLPTFYLHPAIPASPPVSPLPMLKTGIVTFGSFNNPAKINDDVLDLWGRLLLEVPGSRLVLKYRHYFAERPVRERIARFAALRGLDPARIILTGDREDRAAHLVRYHDIDISLDSFPFSGSTTTFEALWMGVPVITLPGSNMASRWSAAMLGALGMDTWSARSSHDYVQRAAALARDPQQLAATRAGLRERVARSPLCDSAARTRQFERLMRSVWRGWCAKQHSGAAAPAR